MDDPYSYDEPHYCKFRISTKFHSSPSNWQVQDIHIFRQLSRVAVRESVIASILQIAVSEAWWRWITVTKLSLAQLSLGGMLNSLWTNYRNMIQCAFEEHSSLQYFVLQIWSRIWFLQSWITCEKTEEWRSIMLKVPTFTFLLLLMTTSSSWVMPSLQFLQAFSSKFSTVGIRIAMPEDNTNTLGILTQVKHFR